MPDPTKTPIETLSFEEALAELEQIVRGLESGQMKLEAAISAYERGAALRKHCDAKLGEAEMRVKAIVHNDDGTAVEEPLTQASPALKAAPKADREENS